MFDALGKSVARHPIRAILIWVVVLVLACLGAFWGYGQGGVFDRLNNSVSLVPGTESDTVNKLASSDAGGTSITVVVDGVPIETDAQALAAFMSEHRGDLMVDGVKSGVDPFQFPDPSIPQAQALFSDDKDGFVIVLTLDKDLDDQKAVEADVATAVGTFQDDLRDQFSGANARIISTSSMSDAVMDQVKVDLIRGETVGVPVALLLLIIVFGGLLAAGLPIVGALVAIGIGMGSLWAMTFATTVESFTMNITSIIGLALSIDYGLLIVSRYREELALTLNKNGFTTDGTKMPTKEESRPLVVEAMEGTLRTAGRTVFFSAVTIAFALSALLAQQAKMLKIISMAGITVTIMAVLTAMTLVPAIIVLMRRVLIKPSPITRIPILRSVVKAVGDSSSDHGFFSKLAHGVHKQPWIIMVGVAAILVLMASPLRDLEMRTAFSDYLPDGNEQTIAYDIVQDHYQAIRAPSIIVVADKPATDMNGLAGLTDHLRSIDDVDYVSAPTPLVDDDQRSAISVHVDVDNQVGTEVTQDVKDLRDYDAGYETLIGGGAALQYDFIQSIIHRAPWSLGIMVVAVFVLMFLMTGSVIVPLKAIIINSLSLLASLGATTWIFMNGYFGMPTVMGMETFIIVCAICFGFGLAMDYEVFLISRIKEFYNQGLANDLAVERGLQRSGRIITSAAAIIVAVFIGFTFGDMVPIKEIGVALAITVITDATLVRMLLVPATMTILGKWNWWAPKPLQWMYDRLHIVH